MQKKKGMEKRRKIWIDENEIKIKWKFEGKIWFGQSEEVNAIALLLVFCAKSVSMSQCLKCKIQN